MGIVTIIGLAFKILIKIVDFLAARQPSLRSRVLEQKERKDREQADFKKNLKEKKYEEASRQLRGALDELSALRRMREKHKRS